MLQRQDSLKKDIAGFDIDQLKPAEVLEKLSLPTQEDIEFEKNIIEEETAANKETFSKGGLISESNLFSVRSSIRLAKCHMKLFLCAKLCYLLIRV